MSNDAPLLLPNLALQWVDALLPKPQLAPPMLMDWLSPWLVVAWDGEVLEMIERPATGAAQVLEQLQQRYPSLVMSSAILDLEME